MVKEIEKKYAVQNIKIFLIQILESDESVVQKVVRMMKIVGKINCLTGKEKKDIILDCIQELEFKELLSEMVDILVSVEKGELTINKLGCCKNKNDCFSFLKIF